jgi:hypothetical protein
MIDKTKLSPAEINQIGIEALVKALGPTGMMKFTRQFHLGSGDYTRDRDKILGNPSLEEILAEIKEMRRENTERANEAIEFTGINMIDVRKYTLSQIRQMGIDALTQALGENGMEQFIKQLETSSGYYAESRRAN